MADPTPTAAAPAAPAGGFAEAGNNENLSLETVYDIPVQVTVVLGKTSMQVNQLLKLGRGAVIELDKMAGEPMEIFVNDKLIAMGEVVVVNEKFGIRLTDVMSGIGMDEAHAKDLA